jgi:glycosyltransferase involved in cell wall biosynthesis
MKISVLIITHNEASNILSCIQSLDWADDIIVLDSYSDDNTLSIAQNLGARVYQRKFDNFAAQRNYALDNLKFKHDWVLHLDADEIVTPKLCDEMSRAVKIKNNYDAYQVPSKTMLFGKWLKYSGMYPVYQVRLGHKNRLRFKQVGHGQREDLSSNRIGTLKEPYLHYSFSKGFTHWLEKHNHYSTNEALEFIKLKSRFTIIDWINIFSINRTRRRRAFNKFSYLFPFRPIQRFVYMYFFRLGFLDGYSGLTYCRLLAIYEYMIELKIRELKNYNKHEDSNKVITKKF